MTLFQRSHTLIGVSFFLIKENEHLAVMFLKSLAISMTHEYVYRCPGLFGNWTCHGLVVKLLVKKDGRIIKKRLETTHTL